jgi:hypothetical protein
MVFFVPNSSSIVELKFLKMSNVSFFIFHLCTYLSYRHYIVTYNYLWNIRSFLYQSLVHFLKHLQLTRSLLLEHWPIQVTHRCYLQWKLVLNFEWFTCYSTLFQIWKPYEICYKHLSTNFRRRVWTTDLMNADGARNVGLVCKSFNMWYMRYIWLEIQCVFYSLMTVSVSIMPFTNVQQAVVVLVINAYNPPLYHTVCYF